MKTTLDIVILEDGKLQITTGDIADAVHLDADQLLDELEDMIGGERITTPVKHPFWENRKVLRGGKIIKANN